jgi:hypothetical protein
MDRDQARFILRSFRPDGADAGDPDFAAALHFAAADLETADWLANERSLDSGFARDLASSPIPEDLRSGILGSFVATRDDLPQAVDALDAALVGAIASIQPPPNLRQESIAAMERSRKIVRFGAWKRLGIPAAAGIALALYVTQPGPPAPDPQAAASPLPLEFVEAGFLRTFTTPFFSVDTPHEDFNQQGMPVAELSKQKLPCPKLLPPGLQGLESVGCRELIIDGKRGSLVCFDTSGADGTVHLVIFLRKDVCGALPCQKAPDLAEHGHFAVAKWCDDRHVFMLLGTSGKDRLAGLFQSRGTPAEH